MAPKSPEQTPASVANQVVGSTADHRLPLVAFIFVLVIVQGVTINTWPLVMGVVKRSFLVTSDADLGSLQSIFFFGGIVSLLLSGYVTAYIKPVRSGWFAIVCLSLGLFTLGTAHSLSQTRVAAVLLGVGNFWILSVYSAVITEFFADSRQHMFMWATAAFAGSAALGNYTIGFLLDHIQNWQAIFVVLGTCILVTWTILVLYGYRTSRAFGILANCNTSTNDLADVPSSLWRSVVDHLWSGLFNRWTLWLLGFLVVLDNLAAGNMITWTAQLFREDHGINEQQASAMLAVAALGIFLGRLFLGAFVCGRFSDLTVLGVGYAGAVCTYGLLLFVSNYYLALALMFLCCAMISAQAPTMYSIASNKFGPRAVMAIPLIDAIGNLGSFLGPVVIGELADKSGDLRSVLWLIPATGTIFVGIVAAWRICERIHQKVPVHSEKIRHQR